MEKKYSTLFGELEKLIEIYGGKLDEKHEYYSIYEYIKIAEKEKIVKSYIESQLKIKLQEIKNEYSKQGANSIINTDLEDCLAMQPYLLQGLKEIKEQKIQKFQAVNSLFEKDNFSNLVDKIYETYKSEKDAIEEINNEKKFTVSENPKEKKYEEIVSKCYNALREIKFDNERIIQITDQGKAEINEKIIEKITKQLSTDTLNRIRRIERLNIEKNKRIIKIYEASKKKKESEEILNYSFTKTIEKRINEYDKEILKELNKKENQKLKQKLTDQGVIIKDTNEEKLNLEYISHILAYFNEKQNELFEKTNYRWRLTQLEKCLKEKRTNKKEYEEYSEDIIELMNTFELNFENEQFNKINIPISRIHAEFLKKLEEDIHSAKNEIIKIEEEKERQKNEFLKELESKEKSLYIALTTRYEDESFSTKDALYTLRILIELKKNTKEVDIFIKNEREYLLSDESKNKLRRIVTMNFNEKINQNNTLEYKNSTDKTYKKIINKE
jgi:hypothetical protein